MAYAYASYNNLIYFENIITQYISYIMTLHTTNSLPFRERYHQVLTSFLWFSQIDTKISIPVQAMKPGNRPNSILISPNTTKPGIDQIVVYHKFKV